MVVLSKRLAPPPGLPLHHLIESDSLPDTVSPDIAIGATLMDERWVQSAPPALRGLARRLPLLLVQTVALLLRARRYDAVVTWGERHTVWTAALLCLRRRRPGHVAILIWPSRTRKATLAVRLARDRIDRFIVPSPLQRRFVEDRIGVPARRFVEARYSVDTRFWRPMEGAGDVICSVGQELRDYATLLEALVPLGIPCHIAAGTGRFHPTFSKRKLHSLVAGTPPATVRFGTLRHRELRELYARSRFVVIPLVPSDNDSGITTILEAFAMGKAVICTESPGHRGLLEHGSNSICVPPFDIAALRNAIVELWNDPERCEQLGAAGRATVEERHNLDQWTAALVRAVSESARERV